MRPIGNVLLRCPAAVARRSISTRGRAITNGWTISMARAIVGNRAISGSDQRPMYHQLLRATTDRTINRGDRWYDQSLPPATDRTSNRDILHVTDCTSNRGILHVTDHRTSNRGILHVTDRTSNRGILYVIDRTSTRLTRWPIVDQSWGSTIDRTINRSIVKFHHTEFPHWNP